MRRVERDLDLEISRLDVSLVIRLGQGFAAAACRTTVIP